MAPPARRPRGRVAFKALLQPETPEGELLLSTLHAEVRAARAELPERQRERLRLVYQDDASRTAAAGRVGVSYPTARRDHHEPHRSLRAILSHHAVPATRPALRLVKNPPDDG